MLIRLVCLLALSSLCLSSPIGQFGKELEKQGLDLDTIDEELKRGSAEVEEEFAEKETQEELAELRAAYETSHGTNEAKVKRKLSKDLFEGDIVLTPEQRARAFDRDTNEKLLRLEALKDVTQMWTPMGAPVIPYSYADGFPTEKKKIVIDSLKFWADRTCIKFRPIHRADFEYIEFNHNSTECSSSFGMVGGKQRINLAPECLDMGTITHELSHAFGTLHVQSRSDRDNYIIVDTDNIEEDAQSDYEKNDPTWGLSNYSIPYEFGSLMHYEDKAGAINGSKSTMYARRKYAKYQDSMGSNIATFYDVHLINKMYKCTDKCKNQISCENNGVQDGNDCNRCFCPIGWTGSRCEKRPDTANVVKLTGIEQKGMVARAVSEGYAEKLYVIEAPIGKRIKATLTWIENQKYLPCDLGRFVEIIYTMNTRINGIRICNQPKPAPIESNSNQMIVRMYNERANKLWINMKFEIV